jgi:cobalt-zinc-cadmium efflux system protein
MRVKKRSGSASLDGQDNHATGTNRAHDHVHGSGGPDHDHGHGQGGHHHHRDTSGRNLLITLVLNLIIPIVQVVGGVLAGSVALISDAMHNFSDFTALFIAYIAHRIGRRSPSLKFTFGYRRAEVLAALVNVAVLVGASVYILSEALSRLWSPEPVSGGLVVIIAAVGVIGNGFSALLLHRGSADNVNIRGAFLHMIADFMTSVVVLINGLLLMYRPWYWLDPLLSLFIVVFILRNCWTILKVVSSILMEGVPAGLDIKDVQSALQEVDGVVGVHHIHAWNVGSSITAFTCHADVEDRRVSETGPMLREMERILKERFAINHVVIQFGAGCCTAGKNGILCEQCEYIPRK